MTGYNSPPNAKTQRGEILALLVNARGEWVGLPEILALRISQYGARVFELRRLGFGIENRTETIDGVRHSWFRLVTSSGAVADNEAQSADWYVAQHGKRPGNELPPDVEGPLFAGARP